MYRGLKILILSFIGILFFSCDNNKVFEEYAELQNGTWYREDPVDFSFDVLDTINAHNIYINIRNSGEYPYSNLYLFVTIKGPDGSSTIDTVNCQLADNRGKWKGKGIGDLWDLKIPYIGQFKFAQKGEYNISYEQAMREEKGLIGISDVGLRVEKSKQ